jgi:hypothetical protein
MIKLLVSSLCYSNINYASSHWPFCFTKNNLSKMAMLNSASFSNYENKKMKNFERFYWQNKSQLSSLRHPSWATQNIPSLGTLRNSNWTFYVTVKIGGRFKKNHGVGGHISFAFMPSSSALNPMSICTLQCLFSHSFTYEWLNRDCDVHIYIGITSRWTGY